MSQQIKSVLATVAMIAATAFGAADLSAQTIATADAQGFLGTWSLPIDAGQAVTLTINITDNDGQVAANVVGLAGTPTPVTTITKADEALILGYTADIAGQSAPISIRLVPEEGETLHGTVDVAEGMLTADGTATKQ